MFIWSEQAATLYDTASWMNGVYGIVNGVTGKVYIGSTAKILGLEARRYDHRNYLRGGRHNNRALTSDWVKYGSDAFTFYLLYTTPQQERTTTHPLVRAIEAQWISGLKGLGVELYNTQTPHLDKTVVAPKQSVYNIAAQPSVYSVPLDASGRTWLANYYYRTRTR